MSYIPTLVADSNDCKLHNLYDTQSCIIAAVCILIGAAKCFYGKLQSYFLDFQEVWKENVVVDKLTFSPNPR